MKATLERLNILRMFSDILTMFQGWGKKMEMWMFNMHVITNSLLASIKV